MFSHLSMVSNEPNSPALTLGLFVTDPHRTYPNQLAVGLFASHVVVAGFTTLGYAIYSQGFVTYRLGYASAIAWVLFAVIMALTALQLRLQRSWVHYDI